MKIEIAEKQIIDSIESVLPRIISDILETTDTIEDIVNKNIVPIVEKIVESGKLDEVLEDEVKRFINDDWDSSDMSNILITRISEKLVLKGD